MQIYEIKTYRYKGKSNRIYVYPEAYKRFEYKVSGLWFSHLALYKYLLLNPERYKEYELEIEEENFKERLDVEFVGPIMWCSSQRFKDFIEKKDIPLDFFPVKVERERRYLMMWQGLPVIASYEVDVKKSEYYKDGFLSKPVFRSDIIEYYNYKMFCNTTHNYIYVTDELKQEFDTNNFKFSYGYGGVEKPLPVTEKKLEVKKVEKDLLFARKKERELYLTEARRQRLQDVDDYLEKVLIKEGDKEILEKFRKEMKGIWKKDFERYQKGLMKPDGRITYW